MTLYHGSSVCVTLTSDSCDSRLNPKSSEHKLWLKVHIFLNPASVRNVIKILFILPNFFLLS